MNSKQITDIAEPLINYSSVPEPALVFEQLCAGYQKTEILHQVTVKIPSKQITCLLGPNGSGKSTLLKVSAGLLPVLTGTIRLFDRPLVSYGRKELARTLSLLPQGREIPDITVEQFIQCGRYPYSGFGGILSMKDRIQTEQAMLATGTMTWRYRRLPELSGGERQRVYLAMVIAQDTDLILLDEPTTYLDIHHQFEFLELLRKLNKSGKTILMSLHDIGHALTYSDFICVLQQGSLTASGTPETLYTGKSLESIFQINIHKEEYSLQTGGQNAVYYILPK